MESKKLSGHIALFAANLIFGVNIPITRMLMPEHISPYALTFMRFAGGMILFWIVSFFVKPEKVTSRDKVILLFASLFALTMNQIPFFVGLSMTSPIDASIVVTLLPIVTMLLAALILKEPITKLKAFGVLVGASGALLIVMNQSGQGHAGNMSGNLIVFMAVTSFALYLTVFKSLIMRYSAVTIMKWMFLYATITGLPIFFTSVASTDFLAMNMADYLKIAFVIVFATFLGYLLLPVGQKTLRPTTLSMYNYVQPIMASIVAIFIGIDEFGYPQAFAAILVFAGVYIVTQSKSRAQLEAEKAAAKK